MRAVAMVLLAVASSCTDEQAEEESGPALCAESAEAGRFNDLTLTISSPTSCSESGEIFVTISNDGTEECGSNIMATVDPGDDVWFASTSGIGGERGSWIPVDFDGYVDGVNKYPPGVQRVWPITLPQKDPGRYIFSLPISCGADFDSKVVATTFRLTQ